MKAKLWARAAFYIEPLSEDQLKLLRKLAALHYDGVCQAVNAVAPPFNGILTQWAHTIEANKSGLDHDFMLSADWSDLDTLLKVLECGIGLSKEEQAVRQKLIDDFHTILRQSRLTLEYWTLNIDTSQGDSHKIRAAALFGVPYEQVTDAQRKYAKVMNYVWNHTMPSVSEHQIFGNYTTGRLSKSEPEKQHLPSNPPVIKKLPEPNTEFINVDFSAIEQRILDYYRRNK